MLALKGVDPAEWTLRRTLNAVEYHVLSTATDEKEAAKIRSKLYTPPRGEGRPVRRTPPAQAAGEAPQRKPRPPKAQGQMSTMDALAMMAAQDAAIGRAQ